LSGIGLALTLNTYNGARAFPFLFPVWLLLVMLRSWHWRGFVRHYGTGLSSMVLGFAIAVAPLAWYAFNHWTSFQSRAIALSGASTLWEALKSTALLFNYSGNGDDFFVREPALEYPPAVFLGFGVLWCLLKLRDDRALFLLLGLAVNLLPGLVSNPNLNRNVGSMIFVYPMIALGVMFFSRELRRLVPRIGPGVAGLFLLAVGGACTYAAYDQYLSHNRRNVWGYYPETTVLGRYIGRIVPEYSVWVGGANFPRDAITYLSYQGDANPMRRNYTWVDHVRHLKRGRLRGAATKGVAVVLANEGAAREVMRTLQMRFPEHEMVDLRYPPESGRVFARAMLVSPAGVAAERAAPSLPAAQKVAPTARPGALRQPRGVAIDTAGTIFVADFGNHRIQAFRPDLAFARHWGDLGNRPGEFREPGDIAVGPNGNVHVADTWNQRVQVFSPDGAFLRQSRAALFGPRGIAVDAAGRVFVSDTGNNRIVRFTPTGRKDLEWGGQGSKDGLFVEPIGIAVDPTGRVYVADNGNGRLQTFTNDGKFISSFPVPGWKSAAFSEPHITVDMQGRLWVTVPLTREVRAYDRRGKLLGSSGQGRFTGGRAQMPLGIDFSKQTSELIVSDLGGRLVRLPAGDLRPSARSDPGR
jgi:sugar lactone lactonase YvrE